MPQKQHSPRIRQLLRQAERVAELDKRLAARQLYEQILEEAPDTAEAWVGLSKLEAESESQVVALEKALDSDPAHHEAAVLLAELTGAEAPPAPEPEPEAEPEAGPKPTPIERAPQEVAARPTPRVETEASASKPVGQPRREVRQPSEEKQAEAPPPKVVQARFDTAVSPPPAPSTEALVCYRHPSTETSLRCNRCDKPICIKCANRTSVGYRCPDCLYELEEKYYTGKTSDYFIALAVSAPLSLAVGFLLVALYNLMGLNFLSIILIFFAGGSIGTLIARLTFRAIGRRRSRYLAEMVAATVAIGALAPAVGLFLLSFNPFVLALPALYALIATGAAYYQIR